MATETNSSNHMIATTNIMDWFNKTRHKYKCHGNTDMDKCTSTHRIAIVLQFYATCLHETNGKSAIHSMYNLIYEMLPYSTVKLINDYHHILFHHTQSSFEFESFYNYILMHYLHKTCDVKSCKGFHRNYRNRNTNNKDWCALYNQCSDTQEIYIIRLLDRIHCFILHSIDNGFKLTQKECIQIQKYIKMNPTNSEIMHVEMKSISNIFTSKQTIKHIPNIITNIDRFTTNIICDKDDNKRNDIHRKYSFGYAYKYWKQYASNKWFVSKRYRDLKCEITSNNVLPLSMEQFNSEIKCAIDIIHSKYGKQIKCRYLKESNDPKQSEIGIKEGDGITIDHMLAILLYSNYRDLQIVFKNTFVKQNGSETNAHLVERHTSFANFGQLLYETIHLFGDDVSAEKARHKSFYHYIDQPIIFQHTFSYFFCPISTISNLENVILCHTMNAHDIVLDLGKPHDGTCYYNYFDCGPISDFTNNYEIIFLGSLLKIKSIINIKLSTNYQFYLNLFDIWHQMLNGRALYEPLERKQARVTDTLRDLCAKKDDPIKENMDEYILELFHHCVLRMRDLHINLWLFDLQCFNTKCEKKVNENEDYYMKEHDGYYGYNIFKTFFVSDDDWVKVQRICTIFENCINLYIYRADWIQQTLVESITVNRTFVERLLRCLSNIKKGNLSNIYIYLPKATKDLKYIIDEFALRLRDIKWQISLQTQKIAEYEEEFDAVETVCICKQCNEN